MIDNLNSIYANSTYTNQTTNSISNKLNSTDFSKATDDELMEVCKDFESYFVEQMLKSMAKMSSVDGSNSDNIYASLFGVTEDYFRSPPSALCRRKGSFFSGIFFRRKAK